MASEVSPPAYYPVFIDLRDRSVLVVGGGSVAERKVESLLEAGAAITVVSPDVTPRLRRLESETRIAWRRRGFEPGDMDGVQLAVSATDDARVQREVAAAGKLKNVLVNTVDEPGLCDFIVPAVARRGDIVLAVSTSGKSPVLARTLRRKLETWLTDDMARAAAVLGSVRGEIMQRFSDSERRKRIFETIVESGILDWIGAYDDDGARRRVRSIVDESAGADGAESAAAGDRSTPGGGESGV